MTWDKQVGGDHYRKVKGEQHWDRVYRLFGPGYFIGCATKYIERYKEKNGKEDLEKAVHFINKLIELEYPPDLGPSDEVAEFLEPSIYPEALVASFKAYEENNTQYLHDDAFLCEGGRGDGKNLYRCRGCRALLWATGLQDAREGHGTCNPPHG